MIMALPIPTRDIWYTFQEEKCVKEGLHLTAHVLALCHQVCHALLAKWNDAIPFLHVLALQQDLFARSLHHLSAD